MFQPDSLSLVQVTIKPMSNKLQYFYFCFRLYVRPSERLGHLDNHYPYQVAQLIWLAG